LGFCSKVLRGHRRTPWVVCIFWSKPKLGVWKSMVVGWSVVLDDWGECSLPCHIAGEGFDAWYVMFICTTLWMVLSRQTYITRTRVIGRLWASMALLFGLRCIPFADW
jgi:hypothetical protein